MTQTVTFAPNADELRDRIDGRLILPTDDPDNVFRLNQNIPPEAASA